MLGNRTEAPEAIPVQIDVAELIARLQTDRELFIQFFLGDLLTCPVPEFHVEIFDHLVNTAKPQFALTVPRGHAKTTITKLAIVHYFIYTSVRFIVYCSNTTTVAKDEARDIINFLKCDNYNVVFGKIRWEKENESDGLWIFYIGNKKCILRALGAGQQVRGMNIDNMRPELLVADDAEDDANSETPDQRRKFRRWVFGPLFKACARHSKKIWIGNLISKYCLINEFCESEFWDSVKYGCILANGLPLWPDMFDLDYLRNDFRQYQKMGLLHKWFAEMMNMIVPEGMGLIKVDEIQYQPARTRGDIEAAFITIDPAISKKTKSDNSALVVHGKLHSNWQVIDYNTGKYDPLELFEQCLILVLKWGVRVVGIESVAYQAALQTIFKFLFSDRKLPEVEVVPLAAGARKVERIMSWASWLKNGSYTLTEDELGVTNQLLNYDPNTEDNVDDLIDACAYGPQMITEYFGLIMQGPLPIENITKSEYEVCQF